MGSEITAPPSLRPDGKPLDPDTRRMLRVQEGDEDAFAELVDRYQHRVLGVLVQMVGNRHEAEDLAQEVFLRVYRSRDRYQPTAKFSTWLFTIANNRALNHLRDRKRKPARNLAGGDSQGMQARPLENMLATGSGLRPSRQFAKVEMGEVIRQAVSNLPDDQRMAVMLSKFEDMNYRQIGVVLDRSEVAVKSLLSRARAALREALRPYLADGQPPPGL